MQKVPKKLTKDQIAEIEAKRKTRVKIIEIPVGESDDLKVEQDKEEVATFYLVRPSREVSNLVARHAANKDYGKANDASIVNCVVAGDMEYIDQDSDKCDDDIYYTVIEEIGKLINRKKARVKKR